MSTRVDPDILEVLAELGIRWVDYDTAVFPLDQQPERWLIDVETLTPKQARQLRRVGWQETTMVDVDRIYYRRPRQLPPLGKVVRRTRLWKRDGPGCYYCPADVPLDDLTIDHVVPRSRGGSGGIENEVLACRPCNSDKDCRTPEEWRAGVILRRRHCRTDEERAAYDANHPGWRAARDQPLTPGSGAPGVPGPGI